jgi:hypothetical protein
MDPQRTYDLELIMFDRIIHNRGVAVTIFVIAGLSLFLTVMLMAACSAQATPQQSYLAQLHAHNVPGSDGTLIMWGERSCRAAVGLDDPETGYEDSVKAGYTDAQRVAISNAALRYVCPQLGAELGQDNN